MTELRWERLAVIDVDIIPAIHRAATTLPTIRATLNARLVLAYSRIMYDTTNGIHDYNSKTIFYSEELAKTYPFGQDLTLTVHGPTKGIGGDRKFENSSTAKNVTTLRRFNKITFQGEADPE